MRVLIVVPEQDHATGNWVTAQRLARGLVSQGHRVTLESTPLEPSPPLVDRLENDPPEVSLLLHAYRSGRPWLVTGPARDIPFAVLLTGTDVNLGRVDPLQRPVILEVLKHSRQILLQNRRLIAALQTEHPEFRDKLHYLPPDVMFGDTPCDLRNRLALSPDKLLMLCPASIRPVKGVLELLVMSDHLAALQNSFHLAFCGPILDTEYARRFDEALQQRPWASYLGVISPEAMASALRSAELVLNNSQYEGLSNALLEATALSVPILARDIPGNAEVVMPGVNGLLYQDEASFLAAATTLIRDRGRLAHLAHPEQDTGPVPGAESTRLQALLEQICR